MVGCELVGLAADPSRTTDRTSCPQSFQAAHEVMECIMRFDLSLLSKNILARIPALHRLVYWAMYRVLDKQLAWGSRQTTDNDVFDKIFETNEWESTESHSGRGSTLAATIMIRETLPGLLKKYDIQSMLDAPCGDFHWMNHVDIPQGTSYIGGDIVEGLIDSVKADYSSLSRSFLVFDILSTPLMDVDMWLCRETLFHFPNEYVFRVLERFRNSNIKYLLTTTFDFAPSNVDICLGDFRMLNLRIAPFSLPRPIQYLDDFTFPEAPRRLGLWSRQQLQNWIAPRH